MEGHRFTRFAHRSDTRYGRTDGITVEFLDGDPVRSAARPTGETVPLKDVRLLAPVRPGKIVAVGRNYADHIAETGMGAPAVPRLFFKPPSAVIGPDEPIHYPPQSRQVEHEAELAVVIGRTTRAVPAADALSHVFGYTCANDVTARDIQKADGQPSWAKAFDTFCPLGPWITTGLDPADLEIQCHINGERRQHARTSRLLTPVADLIAYISAAVTLDPGDIILTGTPAGVGPIAPGDTVEVSISGVGTLSNPVASAAQ
ncbi:fumarylacetoacetate hydrolase family protein [Streptomyces clavuligerus]|uniref:5-carboxymethyl-2-hydroxymuconate delta-isomerase n=1 Tax=Streptomyces clavuligerus TaxID=1901 RepID=B5GT29_STRCL|nr:fumarylacetoacetate hydrolase family protein [Streptomyces clavuligerus]ANW19071.1 2-hydroxyhepta-2,4-diene-1,7-dioate isomerase [Streptomyces clavuligerus]AXU13654.1 FAA hydrolase family protein [Streptomyces clavuligerus]EDY49475.1 5-carboxymethyl-2-hydroxymuconate delta-isomerase [Streptomyces clavuligerus]EFG08196.1 5-carboxymethyl-2-hydroxymuconate delta-isomerase [Streptomyces clavuligerus]MBY6303622.1 fumarylacetoacetate hydrolase family protein [Streptomyces clavuligerus]